MQFNRVEIAGYLTKKPDLRYLPSGTPVANARLGQSFRFQDSSKQTQERTNWHQLSFYGDLAKVAAASYDKGSNLFIEGTIEQREFTPKDGSKRILNEIVVRHCHLIADSRGPTAPATNAANTNGSAQTAPDLEGAADHDWPV